MSESSSLPTAGSLVGSYKYLRQIAQGPFGPLCDLRAEAGGGGLAGLGRLLSLPLELGPETLQVVNEAAWESMEIRHDHALCVADAIFGTGWVMLVHDHSEGTLLRSLQRRCQESKTAFPIAVALRVVLDFLDALEATRAACESSGITWAPGGLTATSLYLCGNGRTRSLDGQVPATLLKDPNTRNRANSVGFPPPELVDAAGVPDERSDVFAAGTVLWELLTGRELSVGTAILRGERPRPAVARLESSMPRGASAVPPAVLKAVNAAIELAPGNRVATCSELRDALTADVQAASYAQVIDFTDTLLHRESTLFRLHLDAGPKLSDEKRVDQAKPPQLEWVVELAKQAQSKQPQPLTAPEQPPPPSKIASRAPPKPPSRSTTPPPRKPDPPHQVETRSATTSIKSDTARGRPTPSLSPAGAKVDAAKNDRGLMKRTLLGLNPDFSAAPHPEHSAGVEGKATPNPHSVTSTAKKDEGTSQGVPPKPKVNTPHSRTLLGLKPVSGPSHTLMGLAAPAESTRAAQGLPAGATPPEVVAQAIPPGVEASAPVRATPASTDRPDARAPAAELSTAAQIASPEGKPVESLAMAETSTALSLLNAELGQAARASEHAPSPGAEPLVALPIAEPASAVAQGLATPPLQRRSGRLQLSLATVIVGLCAAVGLTVLVTVLVVRSPTTPSSTSPSAHPRGATTQASAMPAPPAPEPSPSGAAEAAPRNPEAAPSASPPVASAAKPTVQTAPVRPDAAPLKSKSPVSPKPLPSKPAGRKSHGQYVPSGL